MPAISATSSPSFTQPAQQPVRARGTDADGDNDGSTAATASRPEASESKLAATGSVGRFLNVKA
jgi:hypothetical protein